MRVFLVVKSLVPSHLKKDFDDWYENEHLSEAKQSFSAISASRGWEIENEYNHYAYYEFDNLKIGLTRFIQNPSTELHQIISVLKFFKTADIVFLKFHSRHFYDNVTVFVKDLLNEILKKSFISKKQHETNDKWSDLFLNASRVMVQYSVFKRDVDLNYYEELCNP